MKSGFKNYFLEYKEKYNETYKKHFYKKVADVYIENRDICYIGKEGITNFEDDYNIQTFPAITYKEDNACNIKDVESYCKSFLKWSDDDCKLLYLPLSDANIIIQCKLFNNLQISNFETTIFTYYKQELDSFLHFCYMKDIEESNKKSKILANISMSVSILGIIASVILRFI